MDGLLIIPGVRMDYFSRIKTTTFDPRFTARYTLNDQWTFKGGVGLFHQEPQFDETNKDFGNPDLGPEEAIHYSAGAEYRPLDYLTIDATGFYKDLNDVIARSSKVVERDGAIVPLNYENSARGRVYGLELLVRHEFANNFFGWLSYTVSRSERLDPGENDYRLFDFDQTHILTAVASYRLPRNWEIGVRWRLVSGNLDTPVLGAVFNSDADEYEAIDGLLNSSRLPPFHQLDIRIDKRWVYESWMLTAYLDIQNTYNRSNPEGRSYNSDYTESELAQGLPILPILGLRAEF